MANSTQSIEILSDVEDASSPNTSISSWVSRHFERYTNGSQSKRKCLALDCNKEYVASVSHAALRRHWLRSHDQATLLKRSRYLMHDQDHNDLLIRFIIETQSEYSLVDSPSFRNFITSLKSGKQLICGRTISRTIEGKTKDIQSLVKQKLAVETALALTFDIWSPKKGASGYGCVSAHFIDKNWILKSVILEFLLFPHPHDSESISNFIADVMETFDITTRTIGITTDNGSNVVAGIRCLVSNLSLDSNFKPLNFSHMRCLGHIINLAVKSSLKELKPLIIGASKFISIVKGSGKRYEIFIKCQRRLIEAKDERFPFASPMELVEDVDTRWNSTFLMLQRFSKLEIVVDECRYLIKEVEELELFDWELIESIIKFLGPFCALSDRLSGEKYCTISLVSTSVPKILDRLDLLMLDTNVACAAREMKSKLVSYIEHIYHDTTLIASILDPRFKVALLPLDTQNYGKTLITEMINSGTILTENTPNQVEEDDLFLEEIYVSESKDELNNYLNSPRMRKETDILSEWKAMSEIYPNLAGLARKILPLQATSTPSERLFSMASSTMSDKRHRLHPENFRSNVLLRSWLKFLDQGDNDALKR